MKRFRVHCAVIGFSGAKVSLFHKEEKKHFVEILEFQQSKIIKFCNKIVIIILCFKIKQTI